MRIGIEAQRIFRKKKHGMDFVAIELIKGLQLIDTKNEYFIFVKQDLDNGCIESTSNFKIVEIKKAPYIYWEQVLLPLEVRKYNLDMLHCTSNTAPLKINIPLVITLHDIIYLERLNLTNGTFYQIFGNIYRRWIVPKVVKKAVMIITVSQYEKQTIVDHFKKQNVICVHNGVSDSFQIIHDKSLLDTIRSHYNLPDNYIFFLGNTDPKKNVEGVLKAISLLRKSNKLSTKLLMLDINRKYLDKMVRKIGDQTLIEDIVFSGYVPNNELPAIYSMATLFLYPSLRESFGIPILEAMACGTPVITSNTSSMPEISGGAAMIVNPFNPQEIADAIYKLLLNPIEMNNMSLKGIQRAKEFRWTENAQKALHIYNQVFDE